MQGRLHHAFLFTGARGVGKTTAARILAKALSCDQAPTPTPCGVCPACREIADGQSVDVQEIDAASNNGVDHVRELRDAIRYAPVRGKKKVYILDEVHMLSSGAWNALLKTLEEPPPHAVFIFATTDPHKLPATILSRVQRYDFKLVPARRIVEHLTSVLTAEKIAFDPAALQLVARESGGSVRDSLSLLDQLIAATPADATLTEAMVAETLGVADRSLLLGLGRAVLQKDPAAALALVESAFVRGQDLPQLAQAFLGHLRDLVVVAVVPDAESLIEAAAGELEQMRADIGETPTLPELLFQRFVPIVEEVAKSPVPRQVLDVGLVALTRVEPLQPIGELIERLEAMEVRLERGGATGGGGGGRSERPPTAAPAPRAATPAPTAAPPAAPSVRVETAPAAAPAPAAPAPSTFPELVQAILAKEPRLSSLAQARLLEWTDSRLRLAFEREFAADGMRERLPLLSAQLVRVLGKSLAVEIVVGATPESEPSLLPSLLEAAQTATDSEQADRQREALKHPMRRVIDEKFGGTWREPVLDEPTPSLLFNDATEPVLEPAFEPRENP